MQLSELYLDRYLYRDNDQSSETQDSSFVSADSSDLEVSSIPSGGAAQDINTSNTKIDGAQLEPGTFPTTVLDVANWGWGQTCVFSSTDDDTVSWTDGDFTSADGTTYSIVAGNTGAMTQKTYIYLSLLESETTYQHSTTPSDAVGLGKVLVAVAEDADDTATFMLSEASQIIGDNILANSINASKIVTGSLIVGTNVALGTALGDGDAADDVNSNFTSIIGGRIRTGNIESTGYTYTSTVFSTSGMQINLDNGEIRSPNFAIDSSGNAYLKGFLQTASGTIGEWKINSTSIYSGTEDYSGYTTNAGDITIYSDGSVSSIHANKFYIDSTGAIFATSVTLTGEINATSGVINGDLVATGINAANITTGVLSVGGTDQPTEINLLPSTRGSSTIAAKLNWKDTEDEVLCKVWTDNLGFMGFNTPVEAGAGTGAWTSGGNLNTERKDLAGAGTQAAGLSFGGNYMKTTEEYNGASWSSASDLLVTAGGLAGAGTQGAGLKIGGRTAAGNSNTTKDTEEYDGTTWSTGGDFLQDIANLAGCGTQTAGLAFGGINSYGDTRATEEYDGTTWSTGGTLTINKFYLGGCGTQTAGLSFGGVPSSATVEEYNGTAWSYVNSLSSATYGLAGCGTQTAALCFGGYRTGDILNITEKYDGTTWTSGANLNTGRVTLGGAGTQTSGLSFGGDDGLITATTEEYNDSTAGGRYYFYTSDNENVIISNKAQTVFNYGISCRGNFNVGVPNGYKYKARFTDGVYFDSTDSTDQEIWGGTSQIIYNAASYHYFNIDTEEKLKCSSTGVSINNGLLYLPILTGQEAATYVAQDGACFYDSAAEELKMFGNGSWKTIHIF